MRFIVTQIGARRGYAVPAILERAGMLEAFYTDLTADHPVAKWLIQCGRFLGFGRAAARLAARKIPNSIKAKTVSFGWPTLQHVLSRELSQGSPPAQFRQQLRWSRALGYAMSRRGFGKATHLYSMLGECGPVLAQAKSKGLSTVAEIYIALSAERIVAAEQLAFPGWEQPIDGLVTVRREFSDENRFLEAIDFAICPSEEVRNDLVENFGFAPRRGALVPYGVDSEWLSLAQRPVAGRVLFVGTAGLRKGIQYLAQAAEQLHRNGDYYEFRVAGNVTPWVANQPLCRHLKFLGRLGRAELKQEYATADVFVLPTLAEGSAEVCYEALAAGLPVITTKACGTVARDGIEGIIVPERDAIALASAIERVVRDRQLRQRLSDSAKRLARDYTFEAYGARLLKVLRSFQS